MSLSKATCCFAPSLSTHREQAGFFLINTKMFKKTKGNCYEIYGYTQDGKKAEVYFHPVDGTVVKEEIK